MKLKKYFFNLLFLVSISFGQIVDLFISDYYIGWRGDGTYNNLIELYNPKEVEVDLSNYLIRRGHQNATNWLSSSAPYDASHFLRIPGNIPSGETFAITRLSTDIALRDCANRLYENGDPAGYIDPDQFLKNSGDDALGIFYIGGLGNDTASWIESGTLLDVVGDPTDPQYWDVSGTSEATRYHILQRKFDVCGGNAGNWNTSRGCVDESCSETSYALSEWEVINCANADPNGALYPEPENSEASGDMAVICGGHQYLCLDAPNSPPGEFALESPVTNSLLSINDDNINENLIINWSESYDPDGNDLIYNYSLYTTSGDIDTIFTMNVENILELSLSYQSLYNLLGPSATATFYWDMYVTDIMNTTQSSNGPFTLQISTDSEGGLNQPPTEFNLTSPDDYTLAYVDPSNLEGSVMIGWDASEDPDEQPVSYKFILSLNETLSDPIEEMDVGANSVEILFQDLYDFFISQNFQEAALYWDVRASDGLFEQASSNGPFLLYCFVSEDPANNEETYLDLFISDWYIGFRTSPTYNAAVELYNPKEEPIDLSNYILRRTQNGSHWMETSWIRLDGILPPNSTYVLSRAASDLSLQNCADLVDPDEFLKHNGDDGFKVTHIGYLPESLAEDTTAWLKMGLTLDAIGYADNDPGSGWDVSGVAEATRYYILSRNMDVCGGNGGDWDASRGCVDAACESTSSELSEWTPIACALSPSPGDMPEDSDASTDALIFCGTHNYFCATAAIADGIVPQKVELQQNYPNPFNPKTEISFTMSIQGHAILSIYNIKGQKVSTIIDSQMMPGEHTLSWSGKDSMGREVSSGMYFYKLTVGKISYQRKLILLR